ncbi:hypothetical protein Taro_044052 [Colocasia esculenta]|uniref:Profilin n=1 Tax=Colocasia esculenta TaxID=4460 RepID=A0A843WTK2_COLES|nr:hypothetical protein [Colocasia esculenta]
MSWQPYVDEHLMCELEGGQTLRAAAIVGHDGSVWAQSKSFPQICITENNQPHCGQKNQAKLGSLLDVVKFKPEEITAIMNDLTEPGSLALTGLHLGDTKYMVIQGEAGAVIRGKKGSGGVTVKKTNQALIIGVYDEPVTPGQCNMVVEKLGDYLADQGL